MTLVQKVVADAEGEVEAIEALRGQHGQVRGHISRSLNQGLSSTSLVKRRVMLRTRVGGTLGDGRSTRPARPADRARGAPGRPVSSSAYAQAARVVSARPEPSRASGKARAPRDGRRAHACALRAARRATAEGPCRPVVHAQTRGRRPSQPLAYTATVTPRSPSARTSSSAAHRRRRRGKRDRVGRVSNHGHAPRVGRRDHGGDRRSGGRACR